MSPTIQRAEARRRRAMLILMVLAVLSVLLPFLFWRGTWFGRALTDQQMSQYLADVNRPRRIQHALVQMSERMERGDPSVERWYPELVRLADSPVPEIRVTLAWVLGADPQSEPFHGTLRSLLQDPEPLVRRNAALSLVRFGDSSGREELLTMLRPYTVRAPSAGVIHRRLAEGNPVEHGTLLARLEAQDQRALEIRAPVPGTVENWLVVEGGAVATDEEFLVLSPSAEHVWEALRALSLVGRQEELAEVERFVRGSVPQMPAKVQQQASLTAQAIRSRATAQGR
ncbi:MAG: HEAT repeat domain-containing protein [Acidobacteria bacterium]|nr:HEAT repeat domain-containing protein [Acidobacteriota bacterium]